LQGPEKTGPATGLQPVFLKPPVAGFLYANWLQLQFFRLRKEKKTAATGCKPVGTGFFYYMLLSYILASRRIKNH
jgi:hypothetical protein